MLGLFYKERRQHARRACAIRGALMFCGGVQVAGMVIDLSRGGWRFRPSKAGVFMASEGAVLTLPGARIDCAIRRRQHGLFHCRFAEEMDPPDVG